MVDRAERVPALRDLPAPTSADSAPPARHNVYLGPIKIPRRDSSWWVPLASAIIPGSGQALLGQDRFVAYAAIEAFSLLNYADRASAERRDRDGLRSLAANVARALFPGPHPVGTWAYYELMEKPQWIESGVYNRFPGGTFSPEVDLSTYNGALWLDVRQRYWTDPNVQPDPSSDAYKRAIQEYQARAITDVFRWSWRNAQLEQNIYQQMVRQKNQANRDATMQLEVLAANHVLSAIDALIDRAAAGVEWGRTARVDFFQPLFPGRRSVVPDRDCFRRKLLPSMRLTPLLASRILPKSPNFHGARGSVDSLHLRTRWPVAS